jgi:hypothetical protein
MRRVALGGMTLVLAVGTTGCVAWRPQTAPAAQVLRDPKVEVIQITRADSSKTIIYQPKMVGDTLTGHPTPTAILRLVIPASDITQVSTRYHHIGKSLLAVIAVAGGIAVYGLLQSLNQSP